MEKEKPEVNKYQKWDSPCLFPSCPPARWCLPPEFYLSCHCVSKTPHCRDTRGSCPRWSSGGGSCHALASTCLFQKMLMWPCSGNSSEFMVKSQHTACTRVCCLQPVSLFLYQWTGSSVTPTGSFAHGEAVSPLLNALLAVEPLLPMKPRGSSDCAACSRGSALLPYWSMSSKISAWAPLFANNWQYWNPLFFPHQWFWETVFLCSPLLVFSFFLSFFLSTYLQGEYFSCMIPMQCLISPSLFLFSMK